MSLELLFEDRKIRKYIRDSITEAREIGKGHCDCCDEEKFLLSGFGKHLCEDCITKAFEMADDYSKSYSGNISDNDIVDYIKEGYILPDMNKLNNDAKANFNGSIPELLQSYGLSVHKDWNDKISQNKIYISPKDHKGTKKTRLNKFMLDYSCEFDSERVALSHQPDADGTMVDLVVKGKKITQASAGSTPAPKVPKSISAKATISKATKQSSTKSVSVVNTGYVSGGLDHFKIQLGGNEELDVELKDNNGTKTLNVSYDNEVAVYQVSDAECKDVKTAAEAVKKKIVENPQSIFKAFAGNAKGVFEINKYEIYKFCLDENSFGKELTFTIIWNDVKHSNVRVPVSDRALKNISVLNADLTKYLDALVEKKFPALMKGKNVVRTSLGNATFELITIEKGKGEDIARVGCDLGNVYFESRIYESRLKDAKTSKEAFLEAIMNALYNSPSILNLKGQFIKGIEYGKDRYSCEVKDPKSGSTLYTVYGELDGNEFMNKGDLVIGISVIDEHSGDEQPKKKENIVIRKSGKDITDILKAEGSKIYDKYFKNSNMTEKMTDSAINKMKSSGKKAALMGKIADTFVREACAKLNISPELKGVEVEIDMDVNKDGKPTKISLSVTDPYNDYANDSRALASLLGLDKVSWIKFKKADPIMRDGPNVKYDITDIEEFSKLVSLYLIESEIFDAFGLVSVSESAGRKTFHI